jgi:hypothetical protein
MIEGNIKIWWRTDNNMNLDLLRSGFEIQDLNMPSSEFRSDSPRVFVDIYGVFCQSDFVSTFAGGSIARLRIGDVLEAGQQFGACRLGMLVDFSTLDKWLKWHNSTFVKVGERTVIVDAWAVNFRPFICA